MDKVKRDKAIIVTGVAALLVVLYLMRQRDKKNALQSGREISVPATSPFISAYGSGYPGGASYSGVPGSNFSLVLNGGVPFNSAINISLNPSVAQYLSNKYIPLFGFVGMNSSGAFR